MKVGVVAIDPGPVKSALVVWSGSVINLARYASNSEILALLQSWQPSAGRPCVIEQVVSYGMTVGAEVFETVFWSGRFCEAYGAERVHRMPRLHVKLHLCHDSRARDANIRQALIDRFGGKNAAIGKKAARGPLYGISGDLWAALALAITWWDTMSGVHLDSIREVPA